VKQSSDVWSLGCIYSEAARWLVGGKSGLGKYREERCNEMDRYPFFGIDIFHDYQQRLSAVHTSADIVKSSLRNDDMVTRQVLKSMVEEMLSTEADTRPTAAMLCHKAIEIRRLAWEGLQSLSAKPPTRMVQIEAGPSLPSPPRMFPSRSLSEGHLRSPEGPSPSDTPSLDDEETLIDIGTESAGRRIISSCKIPTSRQPVRQMMGIYQRLIGRMAANGLQSSKLWLNFSHRQVRGVLIIGQLRKRQKRK
jgi:serine/threonine protein kinase